MFSVWREIVRIVAFLKREKKMMKRFKLKLESLTGWTGRFDHKEQCICTMLKWTRFKNFYSDLELTHENHWIKTNNVEVGQNPTMVVKPRSKWMKYNLINLKTKASSLIQSHTHEKKVQKFFFNWITHRAKQNTISFHY